MKTQQKRFKNIDAYIKSYPQEVGKRLNVIRAIVHKLSPDVVETISYNMPAFKINGKILVYFAAHEKHIGLYPYPSAMNFFKTEAKGYKTSTGTIQFQNDEKLPIALIQKIIKYRVGEKLKKK
jgi:uncharacterized protein YdhG (YjbR/CyaY superfamily)